MMNIFLLGIDIAKNVFQLHGVNQAGKAVLKNESIATNCLIMWRI